MTHRAGFALLYSLVLILTAATLTAGMLALGTREALIAQRYHELGRARAAAESEARVRFDAWSTADHRALAPGEEVALAPLNPRTRSTVTRLAATLFLITAEAWVPAGADPPVLARAGLLVRVVDQPVIEAQFPGAIVAVSSADLEGGRVSGQDVCPTEADARPAVVAPAVSVAGTWVEGDPPIDGRPPAPAPPDWPLGSGLVEGLADVHLTAATVTPTPLAEGDACAPSATNWGAVTPTHPCHPFGRVIHSAGNLVVRGGEGRGVLVVEGDLVLEDGFEFHGLVVAAGRATLHEGVRIRGAVRADAVTLSGADVVLDGCAIRDALGVRALDRAYRPGDRWWVPVF